MNALCDRLEHLPLMGVLLFLTLTASVLILGYLQFKRDQLDLRWLILDDKSGRPSIHKIGQVLALIVSTWGFVNLVNHGTLTEIYFTTYMGVWAGSVALNKLLDKGSAQEVPLVDPPNTVVSVDIQAKE